MQQCPVKPNPLRGTHEESQAHNADELSKTSPTIFPLEQLETGEKTTVDLAEEATSGCPRHTVGCTEYECHGALMEKRGFGAVASSDAPPLKEKLDDAVAFLKQFDDENKDAYAHLDGGLEERLKKVEQELTSSGTYEQTFEELQFGCRLAWRQAGRCIMRKVSFTLELLDCRKIDTAEKCFEKIVEHLVYAANGGAVKPVISVFPPKSDGKSAPVRIWNPQLIGYAAYRRSDGTIMGDPARLDITALAMKYGWVPPSDEDKSDFDVLPLVISDEQTGHDKPKIFTIPPEAVLEVPIEHPTHDAVADLNLRWYALPAISNIGIDVGGVYYQTCPFNGWYSVTEIGRDFLDKQRYDLAHVVSIACDIPRTTLNVWRDDVQLQLHRAILHSFAKHSVSIVDHHTASKSFQEFYQDEISKRKKCPADWVWLVPPAGGSMTSVFHQEMFNFILKPQYRLQVDVWDELNIQAPPPISIDTPISFGNALFDDKACIYENIVIGFGSETGTSLRYATCVAAALGEKCSGPLPLDNIPDLLKSESNNKANLLLVVTSTFGKGCAPGGAQSFISQLSDFPDSAGKAWDFAVLALGNSAYVQSFVHFAKASSQALERIGCSPALSLTVADELKNQDEAFAAWENKLYGDSNGTLYNKKSSETTSVESLDDTNSGGKMTLVYKGFAPLTKTLDMVKGELEKKLEENYEGSWAGYFRKFNPSMDLFLFRATEAKAREYLLSGAIQPGDHVALSPENSSMIVESVVRLCILDDKSNMDEYNRRLTTDFDLCRPLSVSSLLELRRICQHELAQRVLDLIVENSDSTTTDDPNDINNTNPDVGSLVNQLPPGSIPIHWIFKHAPAMAPRFFSISSIDEDAVVTISQSVFRFAHSNNAGTTSTWLRWTLDPGHEVNAIFSTTDFHLPSDPFAPVILIAAGSGIAPFRSFWMDKNAKNPMHLFFGTRKESDLPYKTEITQLKNKGRLTLYTAFSRGEKSQYVQDRLLAETNTVRALLEDPSLKIYVCGSPEMEIAVKEKLAMIFAQGSADIPGIGILRAAERLARLKVQGRYIAEVYGKPISQSITPAGCLWDECLAKAIRISKFLERTGVPKPRKQHGPPASNKPDTSNISEVAVTNLEPAVSDGSVVPVEPILRRWITGATSPGNVSSKKQQP